MTPDPSQPPSVPTPSPSPEGEQPWTIGRLLTWTTDFLKRKAAESPRLDAEVLLAHVLDYQRVQLYTHYEDEVGPTARARFRDLVRHRAEGAPVAYLVGRKEFFSLPLAVSPAVLIPRPDTETVVVEFLSLLKHQEAPRAVDVGTGSGAIALACAQRHKSARLIALDLSAEALAVALANAETLSLTDRIEFRQGDLLDPVATEAPFDAILSNPPYIPTDDIAMLEPGVRDYEPHLALDGGGDGLRVVARLIDQAVPLLKPGGHLILEIGTDQEAPVRALIAAHPEFELATTVRDAANHPRVVRATRTN
ncbi:MAG: peptide chain release factor N(5)-glutamine methyltransferase [Isosphaeraceae bacterium]